MIYKFNGIEPKIGENNFIAENSSVIGSVITGSNVSIWFSTVLRADCSYIEVGNNSNIQDNCTVHGDINTPVIIGENVTIGHNCVIHGCKIGNNVVIGMGSILLNGSIVPDNCIIGAGSVVSKKLIIEKEDLVIGNPPKIVRKLSEANVEYIKYAANLYIKEIELYKKLVKI
jgi:carbonic anhydrase/acetyltransferase-like protein (isoleucine patch superfamily)